VRKPRDETNPTRHWHGRQRAYDSRDTMIRTGDGNIKNFEHYDVSTHIERVTNLSDENTGDEGRRISTVPAQRFVYNWSVVARVSAALKSNDRRDVICR